jgi:flagellar hook-associated protein 2
MEPVSLIDAVYSARLAVAGLPALANVQAEQTGVTPTTDPYAVPTSSLTTLSGYGQVLSAASRASEGLESLVGANSNVASSSDVAVATASATAGATAGSYAISITQLAQSQIVTSSVFTDPAEQVLSAGSFSLSVGSNDPVTVTIGEGSGLIGAVNYPWGSLTGIASAINSAGAGVTAAVKQNASYGYYLELATTASGAANTIKFSAAADDPFNAFGANLAQLGLAQSQAGQDANFTIGGVAGTSASNSGITLTTGASFNITATTASVASPKTASITVASTPFVAADLSSVTTAATKLMQNYNALQGTLAQVIASTTGSANTDATALSNAMYNGIQAKNAELTAIGFTIPGSATGALAFSSSLTGTSAEASLLTSLANTLHDSVIAGYLGDTGTILTHAKTAAQSMSFFTAPSDISAYDNLASDIKQYVQQKALATSSVPPGLPDMFA